MSDYYEQMRNQLEQEKFNKTIQIANAKQQAQAQTQNMLNAQGYGNQGYGANQLAQTNNAFDLAKTQTNNDYWSQLQALNQERENNLINNTNNNYMDFYSKWGESGQADYLENAKAYGYNFERDKNGNYKLTNTSNGYNYLTQSQIAELESRANTNDKTLVSSKVAKESAEDFLMNGRYQAVKGTLYDVQNEHGRYIKQYFGESIDKIYEMKDKGELKDNTMIMLDNNSNVRGYVLYSNGKFYYINENGGDNGRAIYSNWGGHKLTLLKGSSGRYIK